MFPASLLTFSILFEGPCWGRFETNLMPAILHPIVNCLLIAILAIQPTISVSLAGGCGSSASIAGAATASSAGDTQREAGCQGCGCCQKRAATAKSCCCSAKGAQAKSREAKVDTTAEAGDQCGHSQPTKGVAKSFLPSARCTCLDVPQPLAPQAPRAPIESPRQLVAIDAVDCELAEFAILRLAQCGALLDRATQPQHFFQVALCVWRL